MLVYSLGIVQSYRNSIDASRTLYSITYLWVICQL